MYAHADALLNVNTMLSILCVEETKWEEIAKALNLPEDRLQHIKDITSGDSYDYLREVCDEWLQSMLDREMSPTWRAIGKALHRLGCIEISDKIKDIYRTGQY